jgi:hypothetical protein
MGFSSIDDMVSEMTAGKTWRQDWNKTSGANAYVAGNWYDLSQFAGIPVANTFAGTTLVAQTPTDKNGGAALGTSWGMFHGGNVTSDTKHLINAGAYATVATAVPGIFMLVDVVMYYPAVANNSTSSQTLINSNTFTASSSSGLLLTYTNDFGTTTQYTSVKFSNSGGALPTGIDNTNVFYIVRQSATTAKVATSEANAIAGTFVAYTDAGTGTHTLTVTPNRYADGAGLRLYTVATATVTNSATPVLDAAGFQYTNQAGSTGRVAGAVVNYTVGGTSIPPQGKIFHSGVASANYGPFIPLQAGDTGVQRVTAYKLSTAYGSAQAGAVVICKPLMTLPIVTAGVAGERNMVMQLPSMPRVYDGACLNLLFFPGAATAANTPLMGYFDFAWG